MSLGKGESFHKSARLSVGCKLKARKERVEEQLSPSEEEEMEAKTEKEKFIVPGDELGTIERWVKKHRVMYTKATRHPFILSIRDGTVNLPSFKRWLGQDYIFVREFIPLLASVLLKAWKESDDGSDMEVLLGGMAALNEEISWFKKEASKWSISLSSIDPQKANHDYCRFLESLTSPEVNYTVAVTAFWAIEAVYQESFSLCLRTGSNTPAELMETCQRWGNDGFGQYCCCLQKIANRNLAKAPPDVLRKAEEAFQQVLQLEVGFWSMSHGEL